MDESFQDCYSKFQQVMNDDIADIQELSRAGRQRLTKTLEPAPPRNHDGDLYSTTTLETVCVQRTYVIRLDRAPGAANQL